MGLELIKKGQGSKVSQLFKLQQSSFTVYNFSFPVFSWHKFSPALNSVQKISIPIILISHFK